MKKFFVVSDIHGMYREFKGLLQHWDREDTLVILGDMVDRGPDSLKVIQKVIELKKQHKVIVIRGNHDQMFLDFLYNPYDYENFMHNGGRSTLDSFKTGNKTPVNYDPIVSTINKFYKYEVEFLKKSLFYYQHGKLLFTHAGFQSLYADWRMTTDNDFVWIRDHYKHPNNSGSINIFGHTPTQIIHGKDHNGVWISKCETYIGIDGACAYGGQLNGLHIQEDGKILGAYKQEKM